MPKQIPGLYKYWSPDGQTYRWHIDKSVCGQRIRSSTGTDDYHEAQRILAREVERIRKTQIYGEAPARTFDDAAGRYVDENSHKRSLDRDIQGIRHFMPEIGHLALHHVHQGTLQPVIDQRRRKASAGTINRDLAAVRRVLTLAARLWRDENGNPWLATIPMIQPLPDRGKRKPYPITWDEQRLLFRHLSNRLERMALFAVNTGMRDQEICKAKWSWEAVVDEHSVLIVPDANGKNGVDRVVVCNRVAQNLLDGQRGRSDTWVFPSTNGPSHRIMSNGWRTARAKAAAEYAEAIGGSCPWGYANLRVHDLRHTFGRRLRAAGVSEEDRKDLLGHVSRSITTEYSGAEIHRLIEAADTVCDGQSRPLLRAVR